jgi:SAM-dependent methyltransferase
MNRFRFWWRYLRHQTPWDTGITPPEIVALIDRLAPGRALELGCGTGTNALYLARHGWRVVGVDFAPPAIRQARRKVRAAGLDAEVVQFYVADVTRLDFLDGPFDLVVDVGCFHGLNRAGQQAYAANLARLTWPGAVFALYTLLPRQSVGVTPEEVTQCFRPAFSVASVAVSTDSSIHRASAWHELRRNG